MLLRRDLLAALLPLGITAPMLGKLAASLPGLPEEIDEQALKQAAWIAGIELDDPQRQAIVEAVRRHHEALAKLRAMPLDEQTPMALSFLPLGSFDPQPEVAAAGTVPATSVRPAGAWTLASPPASDELAFLPVTELSELIRQRQVTSRELTELYLQRLKKFDPVLHCVVATADEPAMEQSERADREIALGRYRGPLHGIPWGAKDLIAVEGLPFTWGIPGRRDVIARRTSTVAERLEAAGAVLVAKLSLGALAMGDQWFGGLTRNPWNPARGSSGSSAGSAAAVVAGLSAFAIGSETLGSIVSPSQRCGATSLRPTFGRVSRDGCMPLAWSFDKLGPMARSVEDLALVFAAIHGADGRDPSARTSPFHWPTSMDLRRLTVGVPEASLDDTDGAVAVLREMGVKLVALRLPDKYPLEALLNIIDVESAAMFDESLRAGDTAGWNQWPAIFQAACFVSAIDYVRMQRVRLQLMRDFEEAVRDLDFWVDANDLLHTNLTGHPSVVLPRVIEMRNGAFRPRTTVLSGHLYQDDRLLAFAREFERRVPGGLEHPPMQRWLDEATKNAASTDDAPPPDRAEEGGTAENGKSGSTDGKPTSSDKQ